MQCQAFCRTSKHRQDMSQILKEMNVSILYFRVYSILAIFLGGLIAFQSQCKPEPQPKIYGDWQTLSGLITPIEYRIRENELCERYPDFPPQTRICFGTELKGDTLQIFNGNANRTWVLNFNGQNVVTVTQFSGGEQSAVFTLERTN